MNLFGWELSRKAAPAQTLSLDEFIKRLEVAHETFSGITVTPETAMESPTVHGIVTTVSRRIATLPIHVYQKTTSNGRTIRALQPNHPVEKLLAYPNDWQTRVDYWFDAVSWYLRYGKFLAYKARGSTGPIRRLECLPPANVQIVQDINTLALRFRVKRADGSEAEYEQRDIHYVRGPARNGYDADSPIMDVREAIALEIAAERMGGSFFGNGAMPFVIFKYVAGMVHQTAEERRQFVEDFQNAYGKKGRFRALLLPAGIETGDPINLDNEKAQFIETRKHQRNVIASALGIPPPLVGDLEDAHFNNIEQQSIQFDQTVIQPICTAFEAAMERDLLTDEDWRNGVIIRFNLNAALRGDFKSQQEALKMMRDGGALSANEWREQIGWNPLPEGQGGDDVWQQGPSGQRGPDGGGGNAAAP